MISSLLIICEFPDVFPDDIYDVPLEQEVKFTINLVSGTRLVSMVPDMMFASELSDLKRSY